MARESPSRNSLSHELRYGAPCVVHGVGGAKHYRLLVIATLFANMVLSAEPPPRAAGGRGPELRSRVTQALEELHRAVAADPANGKLWWNLGIQAQVAAGGSVPEEKAAVVLLERALLMSPHLVASYENAMAIGDMHRGVRNATRARHFYAAAVLANSLSSTPYIYAGLTYELEGNFAQAARAFLLASRVQAHHTQVVCGMMSSVARFAAACWPSHRGSSTYLAYLTAALMKAGDASEASRNYALALGLPPAHSLAGDGGTQLIANAATGSLLSLHPDGSAERRSANWVQEEQADAAVVQAALRRHQFPQHCYARRKLLYAYSQAFGFGAHAHMLSLALNLAIHTDRILVPVDEEAWWCVLGSTYAAICRFLRW